MINIKFILINFVLFFIKVNSFKIDDNDYVEPSDQYEMRRTNNFQFPNNYSGKVQKLDEFSNDNFNKGQSSNEFNTTLDDFNGFNKDDTKFPDDFSDYPKTNYYTKKLVYDYRQPTARTPFRIPYPVPTFYPQPIPIISPIVTQPISNRPQNSQQNQRPQQPNNNNQPQPNNFQPINGPNLPLLPLVWPHSFPNQGNFQNSQMLQHMQLQNALSNMVSRNSFLGFIDPLIIVAIIAIPVIAMLGFSSVVMPFIPVIIYVLNIFFPISGTTGRRRKRSLALKKLCFPFHNSLLNNQTELILNNSLKNLQISLLQLQKSIAKFDY